jgi:hypothetical protein
MPYTATDATQSGVQLEVAVQSFLVVALVAVVTQVALLACAHVTALAAVLDLVDAELARLLDRTVARVLALTYRQLNTHVYTPR